VLSRIPKVEIVVVFPLRALVTSGAVELLAVMVTYTLIAAAIAVDVPSAAAAGLDADVVIELVVCARHTAPAGKDFVVVELVVRVA
jgi:hypothetical protein